MNYSRLRWSVRSEVCMMWSGWICGSKYENKSPPPRVKTCEQGKMSKFPRSCENLTLSKFSSGSARVGRQTRNNFETVCQKAKNINPLDIPRVSHAQCLGNSRPSHLPYPQLKKRLGNSDKTHPSSTVKVWPKKWTFDTAHQFNPLFCENQRPRTSTGVSWQCNAIEKGVSCVLRFLNDEPKLTMTAAPWLSLTAKSSKRSIKLDTS